MFKRIMGIVITIISALGLILGFAGAIGVPKVINQIKGSTGGVLQQIAGTLGSTEVTIVTLRDTIAEASRGLETAETSTVDISEAIGSTGAVFDELTLVMGDNIPASIETLQTALPNLIAVADTVDQALLQLSQFGINESLGGNQLALPPVNVLGQEIALPPVTLPSFPLNFNLGIEYNPESAFDESLLGIEKNLDGIPESLRELGSALDETKVNVLTVGEDVAQISENIGAINEQVTLLPDQIDTYLGNFKQAQDDLVGMENNINTQLDTVKTVLVVLFIWFALIQIAPLYIGVHLALGRRID